MGKTTEELRAERAAKEEIEMAARDLAFGIVRSYPADGLDVELSELDDAIGIAGADARHEQIARWLDEYEREAWELVAADDGDRYLEAFAEAFREGMDMA